MVQKKLDLGPCRRPFRPQAGQYLAQRWQLYSKTPLAHKLRNILLCATMLITLSLTGNYTYSYFVGTTDSTDRFQATDIRQYLQIEPGSAKAAFPALGEPKGESKPVAEIRDSVLTLDFGELPEKNRKTFHDVIKLINISSKEIFITWSFEGDISQAFEEQEGVIKLLPADCSNPDWTTVTHETYELLTDRNTVSRDTYEPIAELSPLALNIKLNGKADAGLLEGYLIIKVNGVFMSQRIPARVMLRENTKHNAERPATILPVNPQPRKAVK